MWGVCVCVLDSQYWCVVERCSPAAEAGSSLVLHQSAGGRGEGEALPGTLRPSGGEKEAPVQETTGGHTSGGLNNIRIQFTSLSLSLNNFVFDSPAHFLFIRYIHTTHIHTHTPISQISLVMPWKKARKLIRDDPRYKNFTESDHVRLQLAACKPTSFICTHTVHPDTLAVGRWNYSIIILRLSCVCCVMAYVGYNAVCVCVVVET